MHIVGAQAMPVACPSLVCMGKLFVCVSDAFQKPTLCILVLFGLLPELSQTSGGLWPCSLDRFFPGLTWAWRNNHSGLSHLFNQQIFTEHLLCARHY